MCTPTPGPFRPGCRRLDRISGTEPAIFRHARVWHGSAEYAGDPELDRAGVVILDRSSALANLLRRDPRFDVLHEDEVAVVFVRRPRKSG